MKKTIITTFISKLLKSNSGRFFIILIILGYLLIMLTSSGFFDHLSLKKIELKELFLFIGILFLFFSIAFIMFSYLEGKDVNSKKDLDSTTLGYEKNIESIRSLIDELNYLLRKQEYENKENFDTLLKKIEEKDNLKLNIEDEKIKKIFIDNINSDFFKELNLNLTKEISLEKRNVLNQLVGFNLKLKERILIEISKLDRKSNINLIIGSLMTSVALLGLGIVVFTESEIKSDMYSILSHYLPRISFIVFIEIFAFFFLKLYKLNINEVKFYQNELTNIELKFNSLFASINFGKEKDFSYTNQKLADTERNFIISKGQTTVELEKFKNENFAFEKFAKVFKGVFRK